MATSRQKLEFQVKANSRQFQREMGRVKGIAQRSGSQIAAALGVGFSVAGSVMYIKSLIDTGDAIHKLSQRTGLGIEATQKLDYAAKIAGQSMNEVERAVKKMQQNIASPVPLRQFTLSLNKLGLTLNDLKNKNPEQQFLLIMKGLSRITDPSMKAGLALQIFGRAGNALIPMLDNGYQGMVDMMNKAKELGLVMGEDAVNAAAKFKDQIVTLNTSIQTMVADSGIVTWLADIAEGINEVHQAKKKIEIMEKKGEISFPEEEKKKEQNRNIGFARSGRGGMFFADMIFKEKEKDTPFLELKKPTQQEITDLKKKRKKDKKAETTFKSTAVIENLNKKDIDTGNKLLSQALYEMSLQEAKLKLKGKERDLMINMLDWNQKIAKLETDREEKLKKASSRQHDEINKNYDELIRINRQRQSLGQEEIYKQYGEKKPKDIKNMFNSLSTDTSLSDRFAKIGVTIGNGAKNFNEKSALERNNLLRAIREAVDSIDSKDLSMGLA